jgi:hypothetical protein
MRDDFLKKCQKLGGAVKQGLCVIEPPKGKEEEIKVLQGAKEFKRVIFKRTKMRGIETLIAALGVFLAIEYKDLITHIIDSIFPSATTITGHIVFVLFLTFGVAFTIYLFEKANTVQKLPV